MEYLLLGSGPRVLRRRGRDLAANDAEGCVGFGLAWSGRTELLTICKMDVYYGGVRLISKKQSLCETAIRQS